MGSLLLLLFLTYELRGEKWAVGLREALAPASIEQIVLSTLEDACIMKVSFKRDGAHCLPCLIRRDPLIRAIQRSEIELKKLLSRPAYQVTSVCSHMYLNIQH